MVGTWLQLEKTASSCGESHKIMYAMIRDFSTAKEISKAAEHRVHRTSAGRWPHFRDSGPNGGFGV